MFKVNVFDVKAKLSEYLDRAARGERIVICRHNRPVAELRPVDEARHEPRPVGPLPGRPVFELPPSFFEPLPADELELWDGGGTWTVSPGWAPARGDVPQVAEERGSFDRAPRRGTRRRR